MNQVQKNFSDSPTSLTCSLTLPNSSGICLCTLTLFTLQIWCVLRSLNLANFLILLWIYRINFGVLPIFLSIKSPMSLSLFFFPITYCPNGNYYPYCMSLISSSQQPYVTSGYLIVQKVLPNNAYIH